VRTGDEVTLIGEGITAEEVARRLDTINYEITCGLTARVPREYM
jgi:alanine racemase